MEILSLNPFSESSVIKSSSYSGGRKGYNCGGRGRSMKSVRLGGGSPRRSWKMKGVPKLRLKLVLSSPLRVWRKLKNGYLNMMLHLGSGSNAFGEKRIPKARRQLPAAANYSTTTEFDNRLVLEIYKSLVASRELATN